MSRVIKLINFINTVPIIALTHEEIAHIVLGFIRFAYRFGRISIDNYDICSSGYNFLDLTILHQGLFTPTIIEARHALISDYQIRTGFLVNHNLPILQDQYGRIHLAESIIITLRDTQLDVESVVEKIYTIL